MKLVALAGGDFISLPNDLLWKDELSWVPPLAKETYALNGALIIEASTRLAGRPITLEPPDDSMGWVTRAVVEKLRTWASLPDVKYKLVLEYPDDKREFLVRFRHSASPVESSPVKGFPEHAAGDWFKVSLKLIEVV